MSEEDNVLEFKLREEEVPERIIHFEPHYSGEIKIADSFVIYVDKKFNWLNRKMVKLFFGWDIVNYDEPRTVSDGNDKDLE